MSCRSASGPRPWPRGAIRLTGFFIFWQAYFASFSIVWLPWILLAVEMTLSPLAAALGTGAGPADRSEHRSAGSRTWPPRSCWPPASMPWAVSSTCTGGVGSAAALRGGVRWRPRGCSASCWPRRNCCRWSSTAAPAPASSAAAKGKKNGRRSGWPPCRKPSCPICTARRRRAMPGSRRPKRRRQGRQDTPGTLEGNLLESSSAAYAGLLATLLVAPLAWCSRRHRAINILWIVLGVISLAWVLDMPVLVCAAAAAGAEHDVAQPLHLRRLLRRDGDGGRGLGRARQGGLQRRWWFWLPALLVAGLACWCLFRAAVPPEPLATTDRNRLTTTSRLRDRRSWRNCARRNGTSAAITWLPPACARRRWAVGWWSGRRRKFRGGSCRRWACCWSPICSGSATAAAAQCDPALYYPPPPRTGGSGGGVTRRAGSSASSACRPCWPRRRSLRDIRGYDAVDPARLVDLLMITRRSQVAAAPLQHDAVAHPATRGRCAPGDVRLHPILDMLNVRYVIFRGTPSPCSPRADLAKCSRRSPGPITGS